MRRRGRRGREEADERRREMDGRDEGTMRLVSERSVEESRDEGEGIWREEEGIGGVMYNENRVVRERRR